MLPQASWPDELQPRSTGILPVGKQTQTQANQAIQAICPTHSRRHHGQTNISPRSTGILPVYGVTGNPPQRPSFLRRQESRGPNTSHGPPITPEDAPFQGPDTPRKYKTAHSRRFPTPAMPIPTQKTWKQANYVKIPYLPRLADATTRLWYCTRHADTQPSRARPTANRTAESKMNMMSPESPRYSTKMLFESLLEVVWVAIPNGGPYLFLLINSTFSRRR